MAFDGTWKVDRSENYDKFMEQMGTRTGLWRMCVCVCVCVRVCVRASFP